MIDRSHPLPVIGQCQLLGVARSTAYYQPIPLAQLVLALMRRGLLSIACYGSLPSEAAARILGPQRYNIDIGARHSNHGY